ncbi:MAG: FMN-binding glutamate synthase family protein [Acidobacteria bacterium]|nr:FMN-binding glutamate synthase family protein [Acidobacteriota bacterium]
MLLWAGGGLLAVVALTVLYDLLQKRHAILRNFPLIGHFRYWLEALGPELRQYIVTANDEERPFSRDERRWVYASAKQENNYFGFGTDNDLERSSNYLILKHSAFPLTAPRQGDADYDPAHAVPCVKRMGAARGRQHAFRPASIVNISGMSFGSLSAAAVEALNRGAALCGCLHNTGEGGVAPYHLHGGELIWQIGTGYFGCRRADGSFDRERLVDTVESTAVRALEIKLSQGAKPGLGGVLPAAKITREIARIRGIDRGRDCISPAAHSTFSNVDSMLDFVEDLALATGVPVGIKSAVGEESFWIELADAMVDGQRGVDFITIDGGEGGTGAGPRAFTDHVALPFKVGFARVYKIFAQRDLTERIVFIGSGKLGFPEVGLLALAMGCDLINVGREAMMAVGCIQAQRCHTGHCPTGVATQNRWLMHGLEPTSKAVRLANYVTVLRKELLQLARACGVDHPSKVGLERFEILDAELGSRPASEVFGYRPTRAAPEPGDPDRGIVTVRLRAQ